MVLEGQDWVTMVARLEGVATVVHLEGAKAVEGAGRSAGSKPPYSHSRYSGRSQ